MRRLAGPVRRPKGVCATPDGGLCDGDPYARRSDGHLDKQILDKWRNVRRT